MKQIDLSIPSGAIFSDDGKYRYALWRVWSQIRPLRMLIGLNPSIADHIRNDPTITRGVVRAYREGFGGLLMANLYAYISSDPKALLGGGDSVGVETDEYIQQMINLSNQHVCGWGSFSPVKYRAPIVLKMIPEPYCLGMNADGQPKHPLYVSYRTPMVKYLRQEFPEKQD